ncbi:hypothetical protein Val02_68190 [Virgisporangium aliadipatigenens]|uniref:DUF2567 domain-containing protein n=1 Tax=Virgisporangium aliadipatigenens TaxID=741659 RepID=A0A8J4DUD0_9ACTN|nr:DUF2567 domain-containing protein [Virgisporangium aliadipatigenens]GIJ49933.1 hypothetical protein Val02_68190 [Virgisporangium aliadipatigenens]
MSAAAPGEPEPSTEKVRLEKSPTPPAVLAPPMHPVPPPPGVAAASYPDPAVLPRPRRTRREWTVEGLTALAVAVVIGLAGFPLAWFWSLVSPKVELEMTDGGVAYVEPNPEGYVAAEGTYLFITMAFGLISALVVYLAIRRHRGPLMMLGLTVGSVAGAIAMAWLGYKIGQSEYQDLLKNAPVGKTFERPVEVRSEVVGIRSYVVGGWTIKLAVAQGAVLWQAVVAVMAYTLLAGFSPSPHLRPWKEERALWDAQYGSVDPAFAAPPPSTDGQISSGWPETPGHSAAPAPPAAG